MTSELLLIAGIFRGFLASLLPSGKIGPRGGTMRGR